MHLSGLQSLPFCLPSPQLSSLKSAHLACTPWIIYSKLKTSSFVWHSTTLPGFNACSVTCAIRNLQPPLLFFNGKICKYILWPNFQTFESKGAEKTNDLHAPAPGSVIKSITLCLERGIMGMHTKDLPLFSLLLPKRIWLSCSRSVGGITL